MRFAFIVTLIAALVALSAQATLANTGLPGAAEGAQQAAQHAAQTAAQTTAQTAAQNTAQTAAAKNPTRFQNARQWGSRSRAWLKNNRNSLLSSAVVGGTAGYVTSSLYMKRRAHDKDGATPSIYDKANAAAAGVL